MEDIILLNLMCIFVLIIILLGSYFQRGVKTKITKRFFYLIISSIVYVIVSLLSEIFEGNENAKVFSYIFNLLTFYGVDVVVLSFSAYVKSMIEESTHKKDKTTFLIFVTSSVRVLTTTILFATGNLFTIENGFYKEENLCIIPYIMGFLLVVELISILIFNKKCFTNRQFVVMILYEALPMIPVIIEMIFELYSLTVISLTTSVLLIYALIQDTKLEESKMKEKLLNEISNTDSLSGLYNRRAYYNTLNEIENDEYVGVVFCDINGLKYANDHYGHDEGDELIKRFSNIFKDVIGYESSYRIGGDEFVAIIRDQDETSFLNIVKELSILIDKNNNIAATGYAYGSGHLVEKLVNEAEEFMYEHKPEDSRYIAIKKMRKKKNNII